MSNDHVDAVRAHYARNDVAGMRAYMEANELINNEEGMTESFLVCMIEDEYEFDRLREENLGEDELEWLVSQCCTDAFLNPTSVLLEHSPLAHALQTRSIHWVTRLLTYGCVSIGMLQHAVDKECGWILLEHGTDVDELNDGIIHLLRGAIIALDQRRQRARAAAIVVTQCAVPLCGNIKDVARLLGQHVWRTRNAEEWEE